MNTLIQQLREPIKSPLVEQLQNVYFHFEHAQVQTGLYYQWLQCPFQILSRVNRSKWPSAYSTINLVSILNYFYFLFGNRVTPLVRLIMTLFFMLLFSLDYHFIIISEILSTFVPNQGLRRDSIFQFNYIQAKIVEKITIILGDNIGFQKINN